MQKKSSGLERESFSSRFGVIAAAAGSAVGLGNIWRFPYLLGENGGAAFLLLYLFIALLIGIPIMMSEMLIGRLSRKNVIGAFHFLTPGRPWFLVGVMGVGAAFVIMAFYSVVGAWTIEYVYASMTRSLEGLSVEQLNDYYLHFTTDFYRPVLWTLLFMALNVIIVMGGVKGGIEKYSKFLMPLLFVIIVFLMFRSLSLDGAWAGVEFLFKPDFSKMTAKTVMVALGQVFFSMSIGMGVMATYGSYISKKERLGNTAISVTSVDTLVAVLSSLVIFPAVFAFGLKPDAGPGLVFVTLPNIFAKMGGGFLFASLFFLLLSIAALTSTFSLLEVVVAYFTEELQMKRRVATLVAAVVMTVMSVFCVKYAAFFSVLEFLSSNILLPVGGMFIVLFVVWVLQRHVVKNELEAGGNTMKFFPVFWWLIKFIAPLAIALVFFNGLGWLG